MDLHIDFRIEPIPVGFEDIVRTAAEQSLIQAGVGREYEVCVSVVCDGEIRDINRRFRNIDSGTDVLSFPLIDFSGLNREEVFKIGREAGSCDALGDIIISADRVLSQAEQYGHSPERELGFLTAHGMLHLLGYDHMTPEDEKVMLSLQKKIMRAAGLEK